MAFVVCYSILLFDFVKIDDCLDCCDGSDEKKGVCPNDCSIYIKEEERKAEEKRKSIELGIQERKRLLKSNDYIERVSKKESLTKQYDELMVKRDALSKQIQAMKEQEAQPIEYDESTLVGRIAKVITPTIMWVRNAIRPILPSKVDLLEKEKRRLSSEIKTMGTELSIVEAISKIDFGEDHIYYHLYNKYFYHPTSQYSITLFDQVSEGSKRIGAWDHWEDGNMIYIGKGCEGGAESVCKVMLECGKEEKILSVQKLDPCKHEIVVSTPVVCKE